MLPVERVANDLAESFELLSIGYEPALFRTDHARASHVIRVPHYAGRLHDEGVHSGYVPPRVTSGSLLRRLMLRLL